MKGLALTISALAFSFAIATAQSVAQTFAVDCRAPSQQVHGYSGSPKAVTGISLDPVAPGKTNEYKTVSLLDENGYPVAIVEYRNGMVIRRNEIAYHKPGMLSSCKTFNEKNDLVDRTVFAYNEAGYVVKETSYKKGEKPFEVAIFSYEKLPDNSLLRTSSVSGEGAAVKQWCLHTGFNADGTVAYCGSGPDKDRMNATKTTYTYNERKQLIGMLTTIADKANPSFTEIVNVYDEAGHIVEVRTTGSAYPRPDIKQYSYTLDEAKNITSAHRNGELIFETQFVY